MRAIRVASVIHNEDHYRDESARRVRLALHKTDSGYEWTASGEDTSTGVWPTVAAAEQAAWQAWGAEVWGLRFGR